MSEKVPSIVLRFPMPEYEEDARASMDGPRMKAAIGSFNEYLRGLEKYGHQHKTMDELLHAIRQTWFEEVDEWLR